jgi:type I restriction enzyme S subunit
MTDLHAKHYSAYKESGVEWLGEVPAHWEVRRIKELGNLVLGKMLDNVQASGKSLKPYLKSKNIGWLKITDSNIEEMYFSVYEIALYRVRYGDLLFSEGGEVGKTAYWYDELNECYIQNSVHKFSTNKKNSSRYFLYLSFAAGHANLYDSIVNFVSIKHLTKEKLARVIWLVPPLPEQTAIAAYLDTKTAQIDRQIELLNKKATQHGKLKQSLINETVTRGLSSSVPMKESGVEWIGEVPAHWEVKRLKELGYLYSGLSGKSGADFTDEDSNSAPFIPFTNIAKNFNLSITELKYVIVLPNEQQNSIKKNDLFFLMSSEDFADLGKSSLLLNTIEFKIYLNSFCKGFRFIKKNIEPQFINYLLHSSACRAALSNEGRGFTRINLRMDKINDLVLSIPPLPEQTAMAAYLDMKTAQIDRIVSTINIQIDKLKELRKTLINDVVTGKINVIPEGELA